MVWKGEVFLARSSTSVFAAAYGAVDSSSNAGANWTRVSLTTNNERYLTSVAGDAAGYILAGGDEGLFRSAEHGEHVHEQTPPAADRGDRGGAERRAKRLVAVKGAEIGLRSTNSGTSFSRPATNSGFDSLDMTAVAFHPTNATFAYAASLPDGVGGRGGVWRSNDGGVTWASHMAASLTDRYVTSLAVDSAGTVYAGVLRNCNGTQAPGPCDGGGNVYSRTTAGASWSASGSLFGVVSLHRDANTGTTIWAGSRGLGLFNGSGTAVDSYTFSQTGQPNLFYTAINAVGTLPGSTVALKAIKGAGVWRSTAGPNPRTWTRVSFPGADRVLSASAVGGAPSSMLMGLHAGGVWRSNDSGANWSPPTVNAGQADFSFGNFVQAVNPFVSIWELSASPNNGNTITRPRVAWARSTRTRPLPASSFNGTSWWAWH